VVSRTEPSRRGEGEKLRGEVEEDLSTLDPRFREDDTSILFSGIYKLSLSVNGDLFRAKPREGDTEGEVYPPT
jgi:hypothetical protein